MLCHQNASSLELRNFSFGLRALKFLKEVELKQTVSKEQHPLIVMRRKTRSERVDNLNLQT